jgi:hypothetical protein
MNSSEYKIMEELDYWWLLKKECFYILYHLVLQAENKI